MYSFSLFDRALREWTPAASLFDQNNGYSMDQFKLPVPHEFCTSGSNICHCHIIAKLKVRNSRTRAGKTKAYIQIIGKRFYISLGINSF